MGRFLPWSKEEEGAYIFWMKQVPVMKTPKIKFHFELKIFILTVVYVMNVSKQKSFPTYSVFYKMKFHKK